MKRKLSLFILFSAVVLSLIGCSLGDNTSSEKEQVEEEPISAEEQVINVIKLNMDYAEKEDLDGYLSTINIPEEFIEEQRQSNQEFFDLFDIDYELLSIEVVELTETTAIVDIVQQTIATEIAEGYMFNHSQLAATHYLDLVDGEWKISATEIDDSSIIYLDANGEPLENAES